MKTQTIFRRTAWLLALGFASALALSACKSTCKQPPAAGQPAPSEHSQKEHPEHPQATDTQK